MELSPFGSGFVLGLIGGLSLWAIYLFLPIKLRLELEGISTPIGIKEIKR